MTIFQRRRRARFASPEIQVKNQVKMTFCFCLKSLVWNCLQTNQDFQFFVQETTFWKLVPWFVLCSHTTLLFLLPCNLPFHLGWYGQNMQKLVVSFATKRTTVAGPGRLCSSTLFRVWSSVTHFFFLFSNKKLFFFLLTTKSLFKHHQNKCFCWCFLFGALAALFQFSLVVLFLWEKWLTYRILKWFSDERAHTETDHQLFQQLCGETIPDTKGVSR